MTKGRWYHLPALLMLLMAACPSANARAKVSRHKFLITSDIHFNPMSDPDLVPELAAAPPTQWESILRRSKLTSFSRYGYDTNWLLLRSSLDAMHTTLPHPALIMITGDLLAHDFPKTFQDATHDPDRDHYRSFVLKTAQFLALQFHRRFGDTPILVSIGNNDENCGNYSVREGGIFLGDTAELARSLAHADDHFSTDWKALGSYNIPHPTVPHLRILSLNTVFFSYRYHAAMFSQNCATVPSVAGKDLMMWLEASLAKAEANHEKVWLMLHIPPGIDGYMTMLKYLSLSKEGNSSGSALCSKAIVPMWVPTWTAQFDSILEKYHDTVAAGLAGHTHSDDFRLISASGNNQVFILIDPPISPIYGQNPGFRVVKFWDDGTLAHQTTYYLPNLSEASSTVEGHWEKEYRFSRFWKQTNLNYSSLEAVYNQVATQPKARDEWFKLYNVSHPPEKVPAEGLRGLYCVMSSLDPKSYETCYCPAVPWNPRSLGSPQ